MKIFSVHVDVNQYQWVMPNIPEDGNYLDLMTLDCIRKGNAWTDINWYTYNPKLKAGNFYHINSGALTFDERVYNSEMFTLFEMAGEIFPINVEGKKLYVLNVLQCINALNQTTTTFDYYDDGTQGRILKYSFHKRYSESSIFKIPETSRTEVLVYSGIKDVNDEFVSLYKELGFTGLVFDELYSE